MMLMSVGSLVAVDVVAAGEAPIDPAKVTPGVIGFLVFFALILATWGLLRSFTRRLGKIAVPSVRDGGLPINPSPTGRSHTEVRVENDGVYREPLTPPYR